MLPQVACASSVPGKARRRSAEPAAHKRTTRTKAQLIGGHGRRRGAVGEQIELAFLDPVLHLAAAQYELLVQSLAVDAGGIRGR